MPMIDMFRLPVFEFRNPNHAKHKAEWSDYISRTDYIDDVAVRFTDPNIHKLELFAPLRDWFMHCMTEVFVTCGMPPEFGFTSMWGTHQVTGGKHNSHTHGNNLFAAVYYLHADKPEGAGTVFENVLADLNPIKLRRLGHSSFERNDAAPGGLTTSFHSRHQVAFEEGKLVVFPAWLRHQTRPYDGELRQIVSFNVMPIGLSMTDPFDRYAYQDFTNTPMQGD